MPADVLEVKIRVKAGAFEVEAAFEAPPGITVLFGPSGAGKSTTLLAVAGLIRPEEGRVSLGGAPWFDATERVHVAPEKRGVSLVFQSLALFPHLDALANVEYGLDRAIPRLERLNRAAAMLERMRVAHVMKRRPATFSGGEAQRVALARAFARSPRLILLDEAFSAMDRELRYELGADVRALVEEQRIPALVVTHHRQEARTLGDRAVLLRRGRVEATGAVRDIVPAKERDE